MKVVSFYYLSTACVWWLKKPPPFRTSPVIMHTSTYLVLSVFRENWRNKREYYILLEGRFFLP